MCVQRHWTDVMSDRRAWPTNVVLLFINLAFDFSSALYIWTCQMQIRFPFSVSIVWLSAARRTVSSVLLTLRLLFQIQWLSPLAVSRMRREADIWQRRLVSTKKAIWYMLSFGVRFWVRLVHAYDGNAVVNTDTAISCIFPMAVWNQDICRRFKALSALRRARRVLNVIDPASMCRLNVHGSTTAEFETSVSNLIHSCRPVLLLHSQR